MRRGGLKELGGLESTELEKAGARVTAAQWPPDVINLPARSSAGAAAPQVGELIGGSQREDRLDVLEARIKENGMPLEAYAGYLDLRRYGTVPHSGERPRTALCWQRGLGAVLYLGS